MAGKQQLTQYSERFLPGIARGANNRSDFILGKGDRKAFEKVNI
jgi:hypothetical protein